MTYTRHGHHITGTPVSETKPLMVARCGGPGLCPGCSREAIVGQMATVRQAVMAEENPMLLLLPALVRETELIRNSTHQEARMVLYFLLFCASDPGLIEKIFERVRNYHEKTEPENEEDQKEE